jgi:site-specific DNA-adenine methylase
MTKYHGGKFRQGKELAKLIGEYAKETGVKYKGYCEPFCGMLGVYRHIPENLPKSVKKFKAGDFNENVVMMWKAAQKGKKFPRKTVTKEEYLKLKNQKKPSAMRGYVGHAYGYGGQFFASYSPDAGDKVNTKMISERVEDIANKLKKVKFTHGSYTQFSNLKGYIIYCDPPYANVSQKYLEKFDSDAFWNWCNKMCKDNLVLVSEFSSPKGWTPIYKITHKVNLTKIGQKRKNKDQLFVSENKLCITSKNLIKRSKSIAKKHKESPKKKSPKKGKTLKVKNLSIPREYIVKEGRRNYIHIPVVEMKKLL